MFFWVIAMVAAIKAVARPMPAITLPAIGACTYMKLKRAIM